MAWLPRGTLPGPTIALSFMPPPAAVSLRRQRRGLPQERRALRRSGAEAPEDDADRVAAHLAGQGEQDGIGAGLRHAHLGGLAPAGAGVAHEDLAHVAAEAEQEPRGLVLGRPRLLDLVDEHV